MTSSRRARLAASMLGGAALLALATLPVLAEDAAKPPAVVNGQPITEKDIAIASEDLASGLPQQMTPEQKRDYLTSYSVDMALVAAEAEKEKVVDQADLDQRLAYFRKKILMEQLLTKVGKDAVTDEAMRKLYDDTVKTIPPEQEAHARHILLETEDEAKKAYDRVKGGEDFSKVAKELSKDPGSSDGGDLGWFTKDRMVKEFADAAFALKPGEISQPVKSQFGWHVIKLEELRQKPVPSFEQVKPQIETYLQRKAQQDLILKLRGTAKIDKPEPPKPSEPAAPPAPAAPAPSDAPKP
ncbi:peptidylprolyl isomerase [Labrys wisconsinensis]|uniref:Parvulin-like PPIase n=1 Tax=Labrys wisconsinensis TaxID=425677 RepID=A0ABU0IZS1_9HYPH|nr:peptidylprolyl isomerase [Labrys wisconsinensis]MDQ0467515.1 peptidyl-prolyl cis-trans isomerase C [Labrys wisconsinensis]